MAVLIVVDTVEASELLAERISDRGYDIRPFHASLPKRERKEVIRLLGAGAIDGIVATTIGDEGIDIPQITSVILLTGKAIGRHRQRIGRASRASEAIVHDFCLMGSMAESHAALRFSRYLNWNWPVTIVDDHGLMQAFMDSIE